MRGYVCMVLGLAAACGTPPGDNGGVDTLTIGGVVTGLDGTLRIANGSDTLTLTAPGAFQFATPVTVGASYDVMVAAAPPGQQCNVQHGNGVVSSDVTDVAISCTAAPHVLGVHTLALGFHTGCVIHTDGTLWCWGFNGHGELGDGTTTNRSSQIQIGTANDWVDIARSGEGACGIRASGTLWCWGTNHFGEVGNGTMTPVAAPVQVGTATAWRSVVALGGHVCALQSDESMWCWGAELGVVPVMVGTPGWTQIALGGDHACGIRDDESLWCVGNDAAGQLGDGQAAGTSVWEQTPVRVGTGSWKSVAAGSEFTCGVRDDSTLWCWGSFDGRFGDPPSWEIHAPIQLGTASDWIRVVGDIRAVCAQRPDHVWSCMGPNERYQLGDGTRTDHALPTPMIQPFEELALSGLTACGRATSGVVSCWGSNDGDILGLGFDAESTVPMQVALESTAVAASPEGSCSINAHHLACWGAAAGAVDEQTPTTVAGAWNQIAGGFWGMCGIHDDASLWCWGYDNTYGQLGDGTTEAKRTPTQIAGASWSSVAIGGSHTCGIQSDGSLWCWGDGAFGALGTGSNASALTPQRVAGGPWLFVSAGFHSTCAIASDQTLWCWGVVDSGSVGEPLSPVQVSATDHWLAIESSELHCGILADHTLRCLRAGISTGTPDMTWSTVSSGGAHACGTHLDGTLWCWGDLVSGGSTTTPVQIGTETNWVEVAAAATHLCGRRSDRSTWCWGGNYSGELGDDRAWRWLPTPIVQ